MDRHEEIRALLTEHALGELSLQDEQQVGAHLAQCHECAVEASELALAFQAIGLGEPPVAPPADLRARVLRHLATEPTRPITRSTSYRTAWLALAATLILILGGLLMTSLQRTARLNDRLRQVDAERAELTRQIATTRAQAERVVAILTAGDMRRIDLEGLVASRSATARAYWSATRGLLIVADQLPTLPPGRTYQVWLIGGSSAGPVSAGLIEGQPSGRGMLIVPPPEGVSGDTVTVAVTDEPAGGVAAPTGSKHFLGSAPS